MSRFDNLEFGNVQPDAPRRGIVKDEAFYVAEADGFYRDGRYDLALRAYSKVLEYNAGNQDAWTFQVRMLIELGELREAKLWADKALERFPIHPELLAAKAVALARMSDLDSALAFSDAAIEERGNTPYTWLARGDVLLARREARASYCFDQALNLGQSDWLHSWLASRIHSFHKNFAIAGRHAQRATELAPDRAVVWLQSGICQLELGLHARARESLAHARQLDGDLPGLEVAVQAADRTTMSGTVWRRMRNLFS